MGGVRRVGQDSGVAPAVDSGPGGLADAAGASDAEGGLDAQSPTDSGPSPPPRDAGSLPDAVVPDSGAEDAGVAPVAVTIRELQDPVASRHPALETVVRLSNVVVTAVYSSGQNLGSFWVQEPAGGPYSGIFVYVETPLVGLWPVAPGDRLTLVGRYTEYFDLSEVVLQAVESQVAGGELLPEARSPLDVADDGALAEAYEGVLVIVSGLQVISENPDAPMDFGEFQVSGGLRIDDALYRVEPRPLPGTTIDYVAGVLNYAFEHFKLVPRSPSDVGPMR